MKSWLLIFILITSIVPAQDNPTAKLNENKKQIISKLGQYEKELKVYNKEMFSPIYKHDQSKKDRDAEIKYLHNKIEKSLFEDDLHFFRKPDFNKDFMKRMVADERIKKSYEKEKTEDYPDYTSEEKEDFEKTNPYVKFNRILAAIEKFERGKKYIHNKYKETFLDKLEYRELKSREKIFFKKEEYLQEVQRIKSFIENLPEKAYCDTSKLDNDYKAQKELLVEELEEFNGRDCLAKIKKVKVFLEELWNSNDLKKSEKKAYKMLTRKNFFQKGIFAIHRKDWASYSSVANKELSYIQDEISSPNPDFNSINTDYIKFKESLLKQINAKLIYPKSTIESQRILDQLTSIRDVNIKEWISNKCASNQLANSKSIDRRFEKIKKHSRQLKRFNERCTEVIKASNESKKFIDDSFRNQKRKERLMDFIEDRLPITSDQ